MFESQDLPVLPDWMPYVVPEAPPHPLAWPKLDFDWNQGDAMERLDERLQALRQGRELLQTAARDLRVPPALQRSLEIALINYPTDADIGHLLQSPDLALVQSWGVALALARRGMLALRVMFGPEDQFSRWAVGVERHFPKACELPKATEDDSTRRQWTATFLDPWRRGVQNGA